MLNLAPPLLYLAAPPLLLLHIGTLAAPVTVL
jgi:hypothetical protein